MSVKFTIEDIKKSKVAHLNQHLFEEPKKKADKNKYGNTILEWEGLKFDSIKELNRYKILLLMLKAGEIGMLERQVEYRLEVNGELVCKYIADHRYFDYKIMATVVEDVKSEATRKNRAYRIKNKLMKRIYNIDIKEI